MDKMDKNIMKEALVLASVLPLYQLEQETGFITKMMIRRVTERNKRETNSESNSSKLKIHRVPIEGDELKMD